MQSLQYLLGLVRVPGVGTIKLQKLLSQYEDWKNCFDAEGRCKLNQCRPDWAWVEQDLRWLAERPNRHVLTFLDDAYPEHLKNIDHFPAVLFVEGPLDLLSSPQVAVVGSRNPSPYGLQLAREFSKQLTHAGFTVTSGLAIGVDGMAHRGALLGTGRTIAVLGSGLDKVYPKSHGRLAQEILEAGGALVSEFCLGTPPLAGHFPRRNRIISGLSRGSVIVEATLGSGSLKTAEYAMQQGREVFAVPGSIHNPLSRGCHALIQQGAKLVQNMDDILSELNCFEIPAERPQTGLPQGSKSVNNLAISPILQYIGYECTSMDAIVEWSGLEIGLVCAGLLELELQGYIAEVPGGYMRLKGNMGCRPAVQRPLVFE